MDRAPKKHGRELKDKLARRFDRARRLPRARRPDGDRPARRVPQVQCEYKVFKNTLVKLAIKGTPMEGIGKYLEGPTAIIFSYESPSAPPRSPPSSPRTRRSSSSRAATSRAGARRQGRRGLAQHAGQGRAAREVARDVHGAARQTSCALTAGAAELHVPAGRAQERSARASSEETAQLSRTRATLIGIVRNRTERRTTQGERNGRRDQGTDYRRALAPHGMQIAELTKKLEDKWGVKAAPVAVAGGRGAGGGALRLRRPSRPSSPSSSPTPAPTRSR